jgi:hypothetical protein
MRRELLWSALEGPGLEHLAVEFGEDGGAADGVVVGIAGQEPFRLRYQVGWDASWRTRTVRVSRLATETWELELTADGFGHWFAADGSPLPALAGCADVDIEATPLTNTLPIRRLRLRPGEAADVRVVYIAVPGLAVTAESQRYVAGPDPNDRGYRFESSDGEFVAEIAVDEDGLVLDYPGLFRRV